MQIIIIDLDFICSSYWLVLSMGCMLLYDKFDTLDTTLVACMQDLAVLEAFISSYYVISFNRKFIYIRQKYKPRDRGYFFWIHLRPLLSQSDLGVDMISLWNMMSKNWEHIRTLSSFLFYLQIGCIRH
jgi:hypothetical protein